MEEGEKKVILTRRNIFIFILALLLLSYLFYSWFESNENRIGTLEKTSLISGTSANVANWLQCTDCVGDQQIKKTLNKDYTFNGNINFSNISVNKINNIDLTTDWVNLGSINLTTHQINAYSVNVSNNLTLSIAYLQNISTTPPNPPDNYLKFYARDDGTGVLTPYVLDPLGVETSMTGGGGGCTTLDCLTDVLGTVLTPGYVLQADGTQYIIDQLSHNNLSDIGIYNHTQIDAILNNGTVNMSYITSTNASSIFDLLSDNITKWNAINSKLPSSIFNNTNFTLNALTQGNLTYALLGSSSAYNSTYHNWTLINQTFNALLQGNETWDLLSDNATKWNAINNRALLSENASLWAEALNKQNTSKRDIMNLTFNGTGIFDTLYIWGDEWIWGDLHVVGTIFSTNISTLIANGSIEPNLDDMWTIGNSTNRFLTLFLSQWLNTTKINATNYCDTTGCYTLSDMNSTSNSTYQNYAINASRNWTSDAITIADLKYDLLSNNITKWNAINSKLPSSIFNDTNFTWNALAQGNLTYALGNNTYYALLQINNTIMQLTNQTNNSYDQSLHNQSNGSIRQINATIGQIAYPKSANITQDNITQIVCPAGQVLHGVGGALDCVVGSGTSGSASPSFVDFTVWATPQQSVAWNWASASTSSELYGNRYSRIQVNLTYASSYRVYVEIATACNVAGADLNVKYSINKGVTWLSLNTTIAGNVSVRAAGENYSVSWGTIATGAKKDVLLSVWGNKNSGTACTTFNLRQVHVQVWYDSYPDTFATNTTNGFLSYNFTNLNGSNIITKEINTTNLNITTNLNGIDIQKLISNWSTNYTFNVFGQANETYTFKDAINVTRNWTADAGTMADLKYDLLSDNITKWNAINSKLPSSIFNNTNFSLDSLKQGNNTFRLQTNNTFNGTVAVDTLTVNGNTWLWGDLNIIGNITAGGIATTMWNGSEGVSIDNRFTSGNRTNRWQSVYTVYLSDGTMNNTLQSLIDNASDTVSGRMSSLNYSALTTLWNRNQTLNALSQGNATYLFSSIFNGTNFSLNALSQINQTTFNSTGVNSAVYSLNGTINWTQTASGSKFDFGNNVNMSTNKSAICFMC